jgi:hypothetical protein
MISILDSSFLIASSFFCSEPLCTDMPPPVLSERNASLYFQVPSGEVLTFGDDNFLSLEAAGVKEARNAAFVLVAGGLGERLGYKGIKVMWLEFLMHIL